MIYMRKFRILIVCPEPEGLSLLTSMLRSLGHQIEEAPTDRVAVRLMERSPIHLVLASVDPGDAEALELLNHVRRKYSEVPVVLMFSRVHPERAKEALRLGAMAVLKFPVPAAELRAAVLQALEQCEAAPLDIPVQQVAVAGALGACHTGTVRDCLTRPAPAYLHRSLFTQRGDNSNAQRRSAIRVSLRRKSLAAGLPTKAINPARRRR